MYTENRTQSYDLMRPTGAHASAHADYVMGTWLCASCDGAPCPNCVGGYNDIEEEILSEDDLEDDSKTSTTILKNTADIEIHEGGNTHMTSKKNRTKHSPFLGADFFDFNFDGVLENEEEMRSNTNSDDENTGNNDNDDMILFDVCLQDKMKEVDGGKQTAVNAPIRRVKLIATFPSYLPHTACCDDGEKKEKHRKTSCQTFKSLSHLQNTHWLRR